MKLTIAHLYYDLCNLYGENGNIKALKYQLEQQGIDVRIKFLTIDDALNFDEYDLVYIGMGTEENQKLALKHLLTYKKQIKEKIEQGTFFFITGNAIELFGKSILDRNGKRWKALNIFDYNAKEEEFRMVDEAFFQCDFLEKPILGFQNQGSVIKENTKSMFQVIKGIGSYPKSKEEGIHENHFYGTYLIGPILVRNPEFLKYIVKQIVLSKDPNFKFKKFKMEFETSAYEQFLKQHYENYIHN